MNLAITWDVTPEIIDGWKTPNYYGLLFVTGLFLGYVIIRRMFRKENVHDSYLDKLVVYVVVATIIGARLGHVLFYGPYWDGTNACGFHEEGYFDHPLNIIKIWEGGLASHGGIFAVFLALVLFSRRILKLPMMWVLDKMVAPGAIAGCFIRLGNLMNSEIVGVPTDVPWAFKFIRYTNECGLLELPAQARHPAQLYEAIAYLSIFGILMFLYWKKQMYKRPGVLFGTFLILLFGARMLIETVKVGQTARDAEWFLNTGQLLSIPFIIAGMVILYRALKTTPENPELTHLSSPQKKSGDTAE